MRGTQSKRIMTMAREERRGEQGVTERGLVKKSSGSVVNSPYTIRAMYQQLKKRFKWLSSLSTIQEEVKKVVQRARRKVTTRVPLRSTRVAMVQKPLMLILEHCQPHVERHPVTGEVTKVTPHKIYLQARRAADRGDGREVQRIAMQFA